MSSQTVTNIEIILGLSRGIGKENGSYCNIIGYTLGLIIFIRAEASKKGPCISSVQGTFKSKKSLESGPDFAQARVELVCNVAAVDVYAFDIERLCISLLTAQAVTVKARTLDMLLATGKFQSLYLNRPAANRFIMQLSRSIEGRHVGFSGLCKEKEQRCAAC